MRFLVTGANGLVGSRLIRHLRAQKHTVMATGRGPSRVPADIDYLSVELGNAAALTALVRHAKPDVIINPAGMTDVDGCERAPDAAYVANVEGVATLCRAATEVKAFLLHVSTDYVFDGAAGPYDIDASPNPKGLYAITKYLGELTVRTLCAKDTWAIARTAVVYGWPKAGNNNFGSWLVDTLGQGKPVKLFADQWVSPSLALNVAAMLAEVGTKRLGGVWHLAGSEVVDRVTFGRALCERFGFDPALITPSRMAEVALASPRPAKSGLLVQRTAEALAAQPLGLAESLSAFHQEVKGAP